MTGNRRQESGNRCQEVSPIAPRTRCVPSPQTRSAPSPLAGEGWGGGWFGDARLVPYNATPTPNPSPQGGGELTELAATALTTLGALHAAFQPCHRVDVRRRVYALGRIAHDVD